MQQHKANNCSVCKADVRVRTNHFTPIIKRLCNASCKKRETLLKGSDPCLVKYLSDCCIGVLSRKIEFPHKLYPELHKYKKDLIFLAQKYPSIGRKRARLVRQSGGFLSLLLPALASSLFGFVANLITRK